MKKIFYCGILSVLLSVFLYSCGTMQGAKASEETRRFEKVIDIPNLSKSEIYIKANAWFVETFVSAESVLEFQDKEDGKIMGKYSFEYTEGVYIHRVRQTISVDIRDNKIRFVINDPYFQTSTIFAPTEWDLYHPLVTQAGLNKTRLKWNDLASSLANYLKTDDHW